MKQIVATIIFALLFTFVTANSYAHGTGADLIKEINGYTIDIGYEPEIIYAGETVSFDFLLKKDTLKEEFTDVWVRITQDSKSIFATGIHNQDFGGTTLLYEFEKEGNYTLHVRYQKDGESITEAEFPIAVTPSDSQNESNSPKPVIFIIVGLVAFILGTALGIIIGRTLKFLK